MQIMATRSVQTLDVYKSVQVQTTSCDVGCNTMSEKGTNTNQPLSFLPIHSKYHPHAIIEYDDIDNLVYPNKTIISTKFSMMKNKD